MMGAKILEGDNCELKIKSKQQRVQGTLQAISKVWMGRRNNESHRSSSVHDANQQLCQVSRVSAYNSDY
jgi:hypothetical protein